MSMACTTSNKLTGDNHDRMKERKKVVVNIRSYNISLKYYHGPLLKVPIKK